MGNKHFIDWNCDDFVAWIMDLNGGKFRQYEKTLITTFNEQGVDGKDIVDLDKSDWKDFGIVNFKHRNELHHHIQELKKQSVAVNMEDFEDQKEGNNDGNGQTKHL